MWHFTLFQFGIDTRTYAEWKVTFSKMNWNRVNSSQIKNVQPHFICWRKFHFLLRRYVVISNEGKHLTGDKALFQLCEPLKIAKAWIYELRLRNTNQFFPAKMRFCKQINVCLKMIIYMSTKWEKSRVFAVSWYLYCWQKKTVNYVFSLISLT